jgi:hypothetical protein
VSSCRKRQRVAPGEARLCGHAAADDSWPSLMSFPFSLVWMKVEDESDLRGPQVSDMRREKGRAYGGEREAGRSFCTLARMRSIVEG